MPPELSPLALAQVSFIGWASQEFFSWQEERFKKFKRSEHKKEPEQHFLIGVNTNNSDNNNNNDNVSHATFRILLLLCLRLVVGSEKPVFMIFNASTMRDGCFRGSCWSWFDLNVKLQTGFRRIKNFSGQPDWLRILRLSKCPPGLSCG